MSPRAEQFVRQQLAASGLAILDPRIAFELRPDMWASYQDCAFGWSRDLKLDAHRMTATVEGLGDVQVAARSLDNLAQRIAWIVGRPVTSVVPSAPEAPKPAQTDPRELAEQSRRTDRIEALQKLAAQVPPDHDCSLRREILAARAELAEAGV